MMKKALSIFSTQIFFDISYFFGWEALSEAPRQWLLEKND